MDVAIAGGHGKVARHLGRMLADRGDRVRGIIRDPGQSADLEGIGVEPVVLDLEEHDAAALAEVIAGADAVVFAAGAGPGSGAKRKHTVDHGAASKLIAAAGRVEAPRYVMISSMGAADPPDGDDVFEVYLRAKAAADRELMASDLDWTVVRPGSLTNDSGTGRVALGEHVEPVHRGATIPREDVAAVLLACLDDDRTVGTVFEVVGGDQPIGDAIDALVTR